MYKLVLLMAIVISFACDATNSTSPDSPETFLVKNKNGEGQSILRVASLRDNTPVTDVVVSQLENGDTKITASGYLERIIEISGDTTAFLMPDDFKQPRTCTFEAIYENDNPTSEQEIQKFPNWDVGVIVDDSLLDDPNFHRALLKTVKMYGDIPRSPKLILGDKSQKTKILISLNPAFWYFLEEPDAGAVAIVHIEDGLITLGEIIFKCTDCFWGDHLEKGLKHEIGHIFGYRTHPESRDGIMGSSDPILVLTDKEVLVFKYLFDRPRHTRPIDNSSSRSKSMGAQKAVVIILCAAKTTNR